MTPKSPHRGFSQTLRAEIAELREALAATEAELLRLREHRSLEMARLERQAYWLERWGIDLDALMRRRPVRAALARPRAGPAPGAPPPRARRMISTVSVVVPVKDGARYLGEVLDAVAGQRIDAEVEMLVVDSGSSDGSVEIATGRGARVIEIAPPSSATGARATSRPSRRPATPSCS